MDVIRRNTDYAIRAMIIIGQYGQRGPVSTRIIADKGDISYQLACKLLQKLHKAGLVESRMGPAGGFILAKEKSKINLLKIVQTIQGSVALNRCMSGLDMCRHKPNCSVSGKLEQLQKHMEEFLASVTLEELVGECSF